MRHIHRQIWIRGTGTAALQGYIALDHNPVPPHNCMNTSHLEGNITGNFHSGKRDLENYIDV